MDRLMHLTRNTLLVVVGLCGSERLSLKKQVRVRRWTDLRIRQRGGLCQMRCEIEEEKRTPINQPGWAMGEEGFVVTLHPPNITSQPYFSMMSLLWQVCEFWGGGKKKPPLTSPVEANGGKSIRVGPWWKDPAMYTPYHIERDLCNS